MRQLQPSTTGRPDAVDLELLSIGAVDDVATRERIEAAASAELSDEAAELAAYAELWQAQAPLPLESATVERRFFGLPRPAFVGAGFGLAAAAAVVLLMVLPGRDAPDGVRTMGGLPVGVELVREGVRHPTVAGDFQAGDRLRLALTLPAPGYVAIATVQDDGTVFPLWRSESGAALPAGAKVRPLALVELDDYPSKEWLVVLVTEAPLDGAALEAALRAAAEGRAPARAESWRMEVTRR